MPHRGKKRQRGNAASFAKERGFGPQARAGAQARCTLSCPACGSTPPAIYGAILRRRPAVFPAYAQAGYKPDQRIANGKCEGPPIDATRVGACAEVGPEGPSLLQLLFGCFFNHGSRSWSPRAAEKAGVTVERIWPSWPRSASPTSGCASAVKITGKTLPATVRQPQPLPDRTLMPPEYIVNLDAGRGRPGCKGHRGFAAAPARPGRLALVTIQSPRCCR